MRSMTEARGHADFHVPPPWPAPGGELDLPPEEAAHATRVLRLGPGAALRLVDGAGVQAELVRVARRRVTARLVSVRRCPREIEVVLELGLPRIRARARMDWAVEKAVELGAHAIHVFEPERGVKGAAGSAEARVSRWRELARAAMKQSGRARWPEVATHASLTALLATAGPGTILWVADAGGRGAIGCDARREFARLLLLVGPEGGLTERECAALEARGARRVALGPHRLRSETAAAALCALAARWAWERGRG
jgi:16S rRNA (uracil1498-N3)-methyltransferase